MLENPKTPCACITSRRTKFSKQGEVRSTEACCACLRQEVIAMSSKSCKHRMIINYYLCYNPHRMLVTHFKACVTTSHHFEVIHP